MSWVYSAYNSSLFQLENTNFPIILVSVAKFTSTILEKFKTHWFWKSDNFTCKESQCHCPKWASKSANHIQVSLSKTPQPKYHITLESLCFLNDYWVVSNARRTVRSKKKLLVHPIFHSLIFMLVFIIMLLFMRKGKRKEQ